MTWHGDGAADRVLASLVRHRLLSTGQVGEMHAPGASRRRASEVLNGLRVSGLVDRVWSRTRPPERVWFATAAGMASVPSDGSRMRPVSAESARGPLGAHLLAVNDVGIAFLRAARARGDADGHVSWSHEVAHRTTDGKSAARSLVIADAVLCYWLPEDGRDILLNRFVELDRGTEPPQRLADKLAAYVRLRRYEAGWRDRYPSFPPVMVVFAGRPRPELARRLRMAIALCRSDPRIRGALPEVAFMFVDLEDLQTLGPFGPAFWTPLEPDLPVDVLGSPGLEPAASSP